jgi:hypothetical protein
MARRQLARLERLGHIVVGAELQADDPVDVVPARGQHDDRNAARPADAPQRLHPVQARHHHVENHDLELARRGEPRRGLTVVHGGHLEPIALEVLDEHCRELDVVVRQQHLRHAAMILCRYQPPHLFTQLYRPFTALGAGTQLDLDT